jgi:hypothetical protein
MQKKTKVQFPEKLFVEMQSDVDFQESFPAAYTEQDLGDVECGVVVGVYEFKGTKQITPDRHPQVISELDESEKLACGLIEGVNRLKDKLIPVLGPESEGAERPNAPEPIRFQLAQRIHELNLGIAGVANIVRVLTQNVEI